MQKICTKCKLTKDLTDFQANFRHPTGYGPLCKECNRLRLREYFLNNKIKVNQQRRDNRKKWSPEFKLKYQVLNVERYGILYSDYLQMLENCNNKCVICHRDFDRSTRTNTPHIDHDHKTGKIRDLLCGKCNSILGYCNDNIEILQRAVSYLQLYQPTPPLVVVH